MTVIAVRKTPTYIEIAADNQTSYGHNKFLGGDDSKLFKDKSKIYREGKLIVWGAGYTEYNLYMGQFIKTTKPAANTVEGIEDFMQRFNDFCLKKKKDYKVYNHFIIIFEGKAYTVMEYIVQEVEEYNSMGSGMFYSLTAMYLGKWVKEAVEVAKNFCLYCGGETTYMKQLIK